MRLLVVFLLLSWVVVPASAQRETLVRTPSELSAAINAAGPGDTIVMANGTWTDVDIRFVAEGAPGDTITLRAETPGEVILNGRSELRMGGSYLKVDGLWFRDGHLMSGGGHVIQMRSSTSKHAHHSRVTNTAVTNYNPPLMEIEYKYISIYGTHNRVDHSHFEGKTNDGATMVVWIRPESNRAEDQVPNYHRIDHNFFGPRPDLGKNGGETIRIGTSDWSLFPSHTLVEHNLFEECDGEIEIISNKSGDNVFRYNTFFNSAGTLTLRHGDRALVKGNFFIANRKHNSGGIRIIGEDHVVINNYLEGIAGTGFRSPISIVNGVPDSPLNRYFQVKRAVIAHNTIVNSRAGFEIGSGKSTELSLPPHDVTIANNVISNTVGTRSNMVIERDQATELVWQGNVFFGSVLGITQPEGILVENPRLVEEADGRFRPEQESPAGGLAIGTFVTDDVDGRLRPEQPLWSGAHEMNGQAPTRFPLTRADVGPSWGSATNAADEATGLPASFDILGAYPNPFSITSTLRFSLGEAAPVRVELFDALGRRLATVADRAFGPGIHEVTLDGAGLAPGLLLYRVQAGSLIRQGALMLIR
jgi:poly(beta-D-mannuronate) lyase